MVEWKLYGVANAMVHFAGFKLMLVVNSSSNSLAIRYPNNSQKVIKNKFNYSPIQNLQHKVYMDI